MNSFLRSNVKTTTSFINILFGMVFNIFLFSMKWLKDQYHNKQLIHLQLFQGSNSTSVQPKNGFCSFSQHNFIFLFYKTNKNITYSTVGIKTFINSFMFVCVHLTGLFSVIVIYWILDRTTNKNLKFKLQ